MSDGPSPSGDLPITEAIDPRASQLDVLDSLAIVTLMNEADATIPAAIGPVLPAVARAVDAIAERIRAGGRLVYVGAGTSGRLATLDAVECVPTFGVPPTLVIALMAGGPAALMRSVEGAEDDAEAARRDITEAGVGARDAVVGLAASGRTSYVVAALEASRERGALTIAIANSLPSPILDLADVAIGVITGPEVLAGSTRLKAGTAQKLVLNMLSTAVFVRLGKVYGSRMVDVAVTNRKLRRRAVGIIADLAACDLAKAATLLDAADQDVKVAVVMGLEGLDAGTARERLTAAEGNLREALRRVG